MKLSALQLHILKRYAALEAPTTHSEALKSALKRSEAMHRCSEATHRCYEALDVPTTCSEAL
eukprot:5497987-Alexandrium_andersonii.AAC.1